MTEEKIKLDETFLFIESIMDPQKSGKRDTISSCGHCARGNQGEEKINASLWSRCFGKK